MGNISYIQCGKLRGTCSQSLVKFCWLVYSNSLKGSANYESRCILLLTAHNFLTNSLTQTATTTILQQLHRSTSFQHWKTDFIYRSFTEWWGAGVVVCLEQGASLHMAQLMPLPLTVSCFSNIQIGFTFLVPAHLGSPGKRAVKRVCITVHTPLLMATSIIRLWGRCQEFTTMVWPALSSYISPIKK